MAYSIEIREFPAQSVISKRTRTAVGGLPELMGKVYGMIAAHLTATGQFPAGPPFAAYYNMDMDDLDVELGFPVTSQLAGTDELQPCEIPGGRYAVCTHVGPYETLAPAYQAMSAWIEENGHTSGVAYEYYLNDPQGTPPEALQTEIRFAILD